MECEKYREFLWDYSEGKKIPEDILKHIENCKECLKETEKINKTLEVLKNLKHEITEPLEIEENLFCRIEKYKKLKKNIKNFSFILAPVSVLILLFSSIFIYNYQKVKVIILYPEEFQILIPEELYFYFKIPKNKPFIAYIDTQNITPYVRVHEDIAFYSAESLEADPGFHTFYVKVFDQKGKVIEEISKTFYLTNYKRKELTYLW
ncbi:MAG: hypothetical protein ABIM36_03915 [candidate division WOR-3 bacterium]